MCADVCYAARIIANTFIMDLSSLTSAAGLGDLKDKLMGSAAQAAASATGIAPASMQTLIAEAQRLMADGTITKEEIIAEIGKLATTHGVPAGVLDTVVDTVMGHAETAGTAPGADTATLPAETPAAQAPATDASPAAPAMPPIPGMPQIPGMPTL